MESVSSRGWILKAEGTVLDPRTKRSVAFYTGLGIVAWDAIKGGLTMLNLGGLLVLAGVVAADSIFSGIKTTKKGSE